MSGAKIFRLNGFWYLKPPYLGTWTLWVVDWFVGLGGVEPKPKSVSRQPEGATAKTRRVIMRRADIATAKS